MTSPPEPSADILAKFDLHSPVFAAQSGLATVWKVTMADGRPAALKCYFDPTMPDERPGFAYLRALKGHGACKIYTVEDGLALMEWLDGPSLGDLARAGQVIEADERLVQTACRLLAEPTRATPDMPHLTNWLAALRDFSPPDDATALTRSNFARARTLAEKLLENQADMRPLHGDLHHDNVKSTARGDIAFDAKGIVGDRCYDLANGFLNPVDAPSIVQNPARIKHLAKSWAQAFDTTPQNLLDWACIHAALSASWHIRDGTSADFTMLNLLWDVHDGSK
ncbi:MAG: aminoglycoside phosphotransferase family protein [Pseudomonadota bacterium]